MCVSPPLPQYIPNSAPISPPSTDLGKVRGAHKLYVSPSFTPNSYCLHDPSHPPQGIDGSPGEKGDPGDVGGPVSGGAEHVVLAEGGWGW